MAQRSVWSLVIVVIQPGGQSPPTLVTVVIPAPVGPFARHGGDEALGLAVGARRVRPGPSLADLKGAALGGEVATLVAGAVIGQHPPDRHTGLCEGRTGALEEPGGGDPALIVEFLGVGGARVVVDGHMHEGIANPARFTTALTGHAVARAAET